MAVEDQDDLIDVGTDDETPSFAPEVEDDLEVEVESEPAENDEQDGEGDTEDVAEEAAEDDSADEFADPDAEEESAEEDLSGYSKNVRKRIEREIRLRRKVEEEARTEIETTRTQATQIITKLREEGKRVFEKATEEQKKYDALQDSYAELLQSSLSEKGELIQERLRKAKEDGDTSAEVKYLSELQQLAAQQTQLGSIKRNIDETRRARKPLQDIWTAPAQQQQTPAQQAPKVDPGTKLGSTWKAQRTWFGKPKFAEATDFAHVIDKRLIAEGYNPNTKDFFVELDRRLAKRFPELYRRKAPKVSVAPVGSGASNSGKAAAGNKVKLSRHDIDVMRRFGLDPSNKNHLREFALQKRGAA